MSEIRVAFRVDGSRDLGLGHIMRCLNVARALADIPLGFAVRDDTNVRDVLEKTEFRSRVTWIDPNADDIPVFGTYLDEAEPQVVVTDIDLRGRVDEYLSVIYPHSAHVSLHEHNYPLLAGDKVIAPTIRPLEPAPGATPGLTHYIGPDYILLPPDIIEIRELASAPAFPIKTVVVSLGGGDPFRLTPKVASAIRACNMPLISWKVILGSASGYDRNEIATEFPGIIDFIQGEKLSRDGFLNLLASADLAIVNGGTTLYETLTLGCPSLAIPQNEFEQAVIEILSESGAVTGVPVTDHVTILDKLSTLIEDRSRLENLAVTGMALIDGRGSIRVADLIRSHLV